jgi:hypothetical protein
MTRRLIAIAAIVAVLGVAVWAASGGSTRPSIGSNASIEPPPSTTAGFTPMTSSSPGPIPSGSALAGSAAPTGPWQLAFSDDFDRLTPLGAFVNGATSAGPGKPLTTADGRYLVFRDGWMDTSGHGRYDPSIISTADGLLDYWIHTRDGYPRTAAITPLPAASSDRGGLVGGRVEVRARADRLPNYKGVWLWWPDLAVDNDMLSYGEIDGPESSFNRRPQMYLHYVEGASPSDTFTATSPPGTSWQDWHDYVTEWIPGTSVRWFIDGRLVAHVTKRVPTAAMHFNLQVETATDRAPTPAPAVSGHVQIDFIRIWAYTP